MSLVRRYKSWKKFRRELLGETLLRLPSVRESRTYVVMEEVKQTTFVAINS
jgi:Lrp/AsnC family transcriptional regulator, leucine-responsive regulatory protein